MLKTSDVKAYCAKEPQFDDIICSLRAVSKQPKGMLNETRKVIALARKFNDQVVRPYAAELDKRVQENPDYLPHEFIEEANRWGLYSLWIPRIFGGKGYSLPSICHFLEEITSVCAAMANLIGVHYLGVATLIATWNTNIIQRVFNDVVEGEKNGHLSTWHMLFSFTDLEKPSANLVMLAVRTGIEGFSFGRKERKMGQKGCPASELRFDDCFVPDEYVCLDPAQASKLSRSGAETTMQVIDYVFSASRAGVGAFGTGVARGAYEAALKYASETEVCGKLLINHEWAQCMLAEMNKNVLISRNAYVESNYANGMYGMYKTLHIKPIYYLVKYAPAAVLKKLVPLFMESPLGTWLMRKIHCDWQTDAEIERTSGLGSLAKITATDAGVQNSQMALDLMGQAGLRQEWIAEKHLRDAKQVQACFGLTPLKRIRLLDQIIS